jgi:hypothetical protein
LPHHPIRKHPPFDLDICKPVAPEEMAAVVLRKHRREKLLIRGLLGVMFAALAVSILFATLGAPSGNRPFGYLGVIIFGSVSAFWWVSFRNVFRDERKREKWEQWTDDRAGGPTDEFISRGSDHDEDDE